jgi:hypothetical protein
MQFFIDSPDFMIFRVVIVIHQKFFGERLYKKSDICIELQTKRAIKEALIFPIAVINFF